MTDLVERIASMEEHVGVTLDGLSARIAMSYDAAGALRAAATQAGVGDLHLLPFNLEGIPKVDWLWADFHIGVRLRSAASG